MNKSHRFLVSMLLIGAYLLSACSGALPSGATRQSGSPDVTAGSQYTEVVFTGNVEAMDAAQWTISGQVVGVEGASIDPAIKVGDLVKVEAKVAGDGSVLALRIEASRPSAADGNANDNMNGNANDNMNGNANDNMNGNANDDNINDNMNGNANDDNANDNMNGNGNDNSAPAGVEREVYGVVEAISTQSVTVSGVTYALASFTEFKTIIAVGDRVKLHVIVASDGSLVVREIERATRTGDDNSNINSNDNDNRNSNKNSNDNGNKNSNDNGNKNSNDNDDDDNDNSNDND